MTKKRTSFDIMKHVDILDQIRIHVMHVGKGFINLQIETIDSSKRVVIDQAAKKTLEEEIIKKVAEQKWSETTRNYIEEYAARMISSLHKNGLVEIDDLPDAPDDPYKHARLID